jgi:hypothetical protein
LLVLLRVVIAALALLAGEDDHHAVLFFRHLSFPRARVDIKNTDTRSVPQGSIA